MVELIISGSISLVCIIIMLFGFIKRDVFAGRLAFAVSFLILCPALGIFIGTLLHSHISKLLATILMSGVFYFYVKWNEDSEEGNTDV